MRELATIGIVAGETGAAALAGLRESAAMPTDQRPARSCCALERTDPERTSASATGCAR
jgi:hypothetical protein